VARTFYRIVRTNPPTLADFFSDEARGKPKPTAADKASLHQGLSVYATLAQARRKARGVTVLGRFVAQLEIPDETLVRAERTFSRSPGHHTLWAEPAELLRYVATVQPVQ